MENVTFYADLEDRVRLRTQQLTQAQQVLQRSAVTDELTGLLNRRGFYQRAEALLESDQPALLAYIDADGLKAVNDRLGHAAGDAMLVGIADSLKSCFRADDVVARMGGDEFCVLMLSPQYDVTTLQQQLEERIARVNAVARNGVELAISIGCVAAPVARAMPLDDWLRQADARMYQDKQSRRSGRT
jgi:diguanylate cyclase (GGDEF)-like protein